MSSEQLLGPTSAPSTSAYSLLLTTDPDHVRAAQRLRRRVVGAEFGDGPLSTAGDLDVDPFDAFCDHLVVRQNRTGDIVGTYRLLPPDAARAAGRLYAEGEFDCTALSRIRGGLVETGRSCVAPEHRTGAVVAMVWAGVLRYLILTGNRWLIGCASVSLDDGGVVASGVWQRLAARHLSPHRYRVRPLRPWNPALVPMGTTRLLRLPPLLHGYLRLGAWVCGPPAHDPAFGCADFPVLFDLERLDTRYARHLLGSDG